MDRARRRRPLRGQALARGRRPPRHGRHGAAQPLSGKPYDLTFEWSDARIYCSELVWKAYERAFGLRLGETQRLAEFDLADPLVAAKLRERYGTTLPLQDPVISPQAIFDSAELVLVDER